jgi:putative colanic acid biosynthesis acetyltransferase WcaF
MNFVRIMLTLLLCEMAFGFAKYKEERVSSVRSTRSLAARRGRPYDKGRGFAAQILWVAVSRLVFIQVWCPNRLRCAILRWFGADIGDGVLIRHGVTVQWPWKLSIGDNSWVGTGAELYNIDPIEIGSDVCISQQAYLCTGSHDMWSPTFEFDNGPIVVHDGAWLCARSTILRGVTIGANSVISATSLISSDVPAGSIVRPPQPSISGL